MASEIDFSAQFGGKDAAQAVLPHFRALKAAAKEVRLSAFPLKKLAFVLRVDGEVNTYGVSGPGDLEFDGQGEYVALDIGITHDDRAFLGADASNVLIVALERSPEILSASGDKRLKGTDYKELRDVLQSLRERYLASL